MLMMDNKRNTIIIVIVLVLISVLLGFLTPIPAVIGFIVTCSAALYFSKNQFNSNTDKIKRSPFFWEFLWLPVVLTLVNLISVSSSATCENMNALFYYSTIIPYLMVLRGIYLAYKVNFSNQWLPVISFGLYIILASIVFLIPFLAALFPLAFCGG